MRFCWAIFFNHSAFVLRAFTELYFKRVLLFLFFFVNNEKKKLIA